MNRRTFLVNSTLATATASTLLANSTYSASGPPPDNKLPRWRGFNLLEKFVARPARDGSGTRRVAYRERDFEWMADWGFDFARLPMSYQCWAVGDPARWTELDEKSLKQVDEAVALGKTHKVHVNLNLHRLPGYCVNPPAEPLDLWTDPRALEAAVFHWRHLAERYKGIPNTEVSFDLINEPAKVDETAYVRVITALVAGIRSVDPNRLIIADGLNYGTMPVPGLVGLEVGQSTRGYGPFRLSHYKASWAQGSDTWPVPTWPMPEGDKIWDAQALQKSNIAPWQKLQQQGVGIHVGEWGCYNKTPHDVALAWMEDQLKLWQAAGWGWSLWNFRGEFGILNSNRQDVAYEDHKGEKLDRRMMELLMRY